jgi:hypothetical protein
VDWICLDDGDTGTCDLCDPSTGSVTHLPADTCP